MWICAYDFKETVQREKHAFLPNGIYTLISIIKIGQLGFDNKLKGLKELCGSAYLK